VQMQLIKPFIDDYLIMQSFWEKITDCRLACRG